MDDWFMFPTVVVAMSPFITLWDLDLDAGYNIMAGLREMYNWYHELGDNDE